MMIETTIEVCTVRTSYGCLVSTLKDREGYKHV